tara:strand:+ start:798 stop:1001 length:204 start_codon:yes stop_codon:yes gene_type:complete
MYSDVTDAGDSDIGDAGSRERPRNWEPVCSGGGTPVYNASDYLHNFFGFCNAYCKEAERQQTCQIED